MNNTEPSMTTIHECWDESEADIVSSYLDANGVQTFTQGFVRSVYPFTVDGLGKIDIQVATCDVERACKLLEDRVESSPDNA